MWALKLSGFGQRGGMWFSRAALFLLRMIYDPKNDIE
jgi:hypothetical protein